MARWKANRRASLPPLLRPTAARRRCLLTMMVPLLHLGMVIVGVPYSTPGMIHSEARGGTPYGASTIAGATNDLQPAPGDLAIAKAQGKRVAEAALALRSKKYSL